MITDPTGHPPTTKELLAALYPEVEGQPPVLRQMNLDRDLYWYSPGIVRQMLEKDILEQQRLADWQAEGERLLDGRGMGAMFRLGRWWADRPWRRAP